MIDDRQQPLQLLTQRRAHPFRIRPGSRRDPSRPPGGPGFQMSSEAGQVEHRGPRRDEPYQLQLVNGARLGAAWRGKRRARCCSDVGRRRQVIRTFVSCPQALSHFDPLAPFRTAPGELRRPRRVYFTAPRSLKSANIGYLLGQPLPSGRGSGAFACFDEGGNPPGVRATLTTV